MSKIGRADSRTDGPVATEMTRRVGMPLYDFRARSCGRTFEELGAADAPAPACRDAAAKPRGWCPWGAATGRRGLDRLGGQWPTRAAGAPTCGPFGPPTRRHLPGVDARGGISPLEDGEGGSGDAGRERRAGAPGGLGAVRGQARVPGGRERAGKTAAQGGGNAFFAGRGRLPLVSRHALPGGPSEAMPRPFITPGPCSGPWRPCGT
jgi:hypothetical protein